MSSLYCYCSQWWSYIQGWFFPPSSSLPVSRQQMRQEIDELVLSSQESVERTATALCQLLEEERQKRYKLEKAYLDMNAEVFELQYQIQRLYKRLDHQQRHKQRGQRNRNQQREREREREGKRGLKNQRAGLIKAEEVEIEEKGID